MIKFKRHFSKGFEDLLGREESMANFSNGVKGRKFSNCFKKLAETVNIDVDEIITEIRSNATGVGREEVGKRQVGQSDIRS